MRVSLVVHLLVLALCSATVSPDGASAYVAGGGKDARKGNDCLIGFDGIEPEQVTLEGATAVVSCTDCDPSCDRDGVGTADGSCTIAVGVCINQIGVSGCTPPSRLDQASAKGKVKGAKGADGAVPLMVPPVLEGTACGARLDVRIPIKQTKRGPRDGKVSVRLAASVKKNRSEGISARSDKDKLTYLCRSRREGDPCPGTVTTTSTLTSTTTTTTSLTTTTTIGAIMDGGFETGPLGTAWTQSSTNFGSPICSSACGFGLGTGPRTGTYWAYFGGVDTNETATLTQTVLLGAGAPNLAFWLEIPSCDPIDSDTFSVRVDGTTIFSTTASDPACNTTGYVKKTLDVSAYADGGAHTIEFRGVFTPGELDGITNFMVDDVALEPAP